jgi:parvulin-like peptidyl-prolyl isomerase
MVRAFEDVAFNLRPGIVGPVVLTQYGYHIILVERVQPAEVKARHILFSPQVSDSDIAAAHGRADSVAALIRAGASADSLARIYGDTTEPRTIDAADRTQMQTGYAEALTGAQKDSVVGPFQLEPTAPTRTRFVVVRVSDVQPEREYTFEEVREQIRQRLTQDRGIRNLLDDLRRHAYVDVRL